MSKARKISPGATRGTVFGKVAEVRLADAKALLDARRYAGAVYLGGYAIECLLKWAVTDRKQCVYLPANLEIHNWDTLIAKAGLVGSLQAAPMIQALFSELSERWGPELGYLPQPMPSFEARQLYDHLLDGCIWNRA